MRKLPTKFLEKVWGTTSLEPWYPNTAGKTGEVWFESPEDIPLLVKFIFTSERLSIQVHPNDEQAQAAGFERGKTEMWYVVRADPGGVLGVGLQHVISRDELRQSCESGSIEQLVRWIPVNRGDVVFVPAGTIHAIGAGVALCEIQQLSDVTYRLYDYGRPRELHLDAGIDVSIPGVHPGLVTRLSNTPLVSCDYFITHELEARTPVTAPAGILIVLEGAGDVGDERYQQGEAWLLDSPTRVAPATQSLFLHTRTPTY